MFFLDKNIGIMAGFIDLDTDIHYCVGVFSLVIISLREARF